MCNLSVAVYKIRKAPAWEEPTCLSHEIHLPNGGIGHSRQNFGPPIFRLHLPVDILAKNITFTAPEYLLIGENQEPMREIAFLESPTTTVPFSWIYDT